MNTESPIVRVAIPGPLFAPFDYRWPADAPPAVAGQRVRVRFGRRRLIGFVVEASVSSDIDERRLRTVESVLDHGPVFTTEVYELLCWSARYYHHPLGGCLDTALPTLLRQGRSAETGTQTQWRLTDRGGEIDPSDLERRAPRQAELLRRLQCHGFLTAAHFPEAAGGDWRGGLRRLVGHEWAETVRTPAYAVIQGTGRAGAPALNDAQSKAAAALGDTAMRSPVLIDGVTGSGKTAVYLDAIARTVAAGRQALVVVPEIGLTPQLVDRFAERLDQPIVVLHSALSDGERLSAWIAARDGEASVVIGTRSAIFTPLARPGLIVVDEEHDGSLKQQEGFRYHARDLAIVRAHRLGIPVALGSATPSLETLHNADQGRFRRVPLPTRATGATMPQFRLLDMRGKPLRDGLSAPLIEHVRAHLDQGGQALLFLNRRGYAPTLLCHECAWIAECDRCDARYTFHQGARRLHCHHCDAERPVPRSCPTCRSSDLRPLGLGTERVEDALREAFPDIGVLRIDRDSTRRKGEFERRMAKAHNGDARLLLGTQMLAKGHHLPGVTLVGIIDADQGLFGADFRSPERLSQLIVQVAGRAGRAERPGEVVIQTHQPEHPLLQRLIGSGYDRFAADALEERRLAALPPFSSLALLRAEAVSVEAPQAFLGEAAGIVNGYGIDEVECLGPAPAPMARRAGRHRQQLLLHAVDRRRLHRVLTPLAPALVTLASARRVRWSLDVDPLDLL